MEFIEDIECKHCNNNKKTVYITVGSNTTDIEKMETVPVYNVPTLTCEKCGVENYNNLTSLLLHYISIDLLLHGIKHYVDFNSYYELYKNHQIDLNKIRNESLKDFHKEEKCDTSKKEDINKFIDKNTCYHNINISLEYYKDGKLKEDKIYSLPIKETDYGAIIVEPETVEKFVKEIKSTTVEDTVTISTGILDNGFKVVKSSAAVSKNNYNKSIGEDINKKNIINKAWELLGFLTKFANNHIENKKRNNH